jgi:hypothetical protein
MFPKQVSHDSAENVTSDSADDGRPDSHLRQIDGGIGRTATDRQNEPFRHDQLAGRGEVRNRRTNMIRDNDPGAKDLRRIIHHCPQERDWFCLGGIVATAIRTALGQKCFSFFREKATMAANQSAKHLRS